MPRLGNIKDRWVFVAYRNCTCALYRFGYRWQCASTARSFRSCDYSRWSCLPSGSPPASSGSSRRSGRTTTRGCRVCCPLVTTRCRQRPPARRLACSRPRRLAFHEPPRSKDSGAAVTPTTTLSAPGSGTTTSNSKNAFPVRIYLFIYLLSPPFARVCF